MKRSQSRQGFLVSAIVHMLILMALSSKIASIVAPEKVPEAPDAHRRVFLPPPSLLRELAQAERSKQPRPVPTPPPPSAKDRISVGGPSPVRQERLELRRDEEISAAKGRPDSSPQVTPTPAPAATPTTARAGNPDNRETVAPGLRLPTGPGQMASGREAAEQRGSRGSSIASSLRDLDARLQHLEPPGILTGKGHQTALQFDDQGADFTAWTERFRTEVYRNWIMPQPALMGMGGQVEIQFTVERDGRISSLHVTRSSGVPALDRAAINALNGSRFLTLPEDYRPSSVTITVTFSYNMAPQGA